MPDDDRGPVRRPHPEGRGQAGGQRPYGAAGTGRQTSYGYRSAGRRGPAVPSILLSDGRSQRRLSEFLMPAAVILAGVLLVVAFAFIISGSRREDKAAITGPQPPALGGVQLEPTPEQTIPLPSGSPSPSSSPTPSPSRSPARTSPPPDRGSVSINRSGVPDEVDLSDEGSRDWVHWGEAGTFSLERDRDGDFQILEGAPTAPRFRHALSPQRFTWTDGSPVDNSDGTPTGIRTCDKGNGFTISAPATRTSRTLRLYIGAVAARGRLTAKLTTGAASGTATFEQRDGDLATAVFTVTYRAPKDGTLKLTWITEQSFNDDCGGVALEAATLR
ncbi:hypothetical protein EV385_0090 [Krasilnikovia cinnamomea]|uniref:Uncharacterized protein n=1 Tax=Krasilnikovia cinnamomea TaxID=349313 RepID=A0A4V2G6D9_9ACTN|nr:hypothetical protein [Krasilnikovia cinnamomea]RZU48376.1 hypothetical protein EV385_0090 [Krasilnikovia cinnamomea]